MTTSTLSQPPDLTERQAGRHVLTVSIVVALAIMGDSFMYGVLPVEAERLGITLPLVGILLSANRIVRLVSNTWMGGIFERFGPRLPLIGAAILGCGTTFLYGAGWGFVVFLVARLGWGVAWSGLRQAGYQSIWSGHVQTRGRLTGVLWGVVRLGSAIGVLLGGFLRDSYGYELAVFVIGAFGLVGIWVATTIKWPKEADPQAPPKPQQASGNFWLGWQLIFSHPSRRWLLLASVLSRILGATVLSTASLFLLERLGGSEALLPGLGIGTVAGLILALRWTSGLFVGPAVGVASDRIGQPLMALLLAALMMGCTIAALAFGGPWALIALGGMMLADSGSFITLDAAATSQAQHSKRPHLFMGAWATAMDAASATGPLLGFTLVSAAGFAPLYLTLAILLLLFALRYWTLMR